MAKSHFVNLVKPADKRAAIANARKKVFKGGDRVAILVSYSFRFSCDVAVHFSETIDCVYKMDKSRLRAIHDPLCGIGQFPQSATAVRHWLETLSRISQFLSAILKHRKTRKTNLVGAVVKAKKRMKGVEGGATLPRIIWFQGTVAE